MSVLQFTLEDHILTTAIAIDKDKNSKYAVKWAIDNLLGEKNHCVILHVGNQSSSPWDNHPVPKGGRPPTETEVHQLFLPYRGFCVRKGIVAKEVVLHDNEVSTALLEYITDNPISNIVVGASNRNAITRSFKKLDVPTTLCRNAPELCSVYVIHKGKLQYFQSSSQPSTPSISLTTKKLPSPISLTLKHPPKSPVSEDTSRNGSTISESWRSVNSEMRTIGSNRSNDSSIQSTPRDRYSHRKIPSPIRSPEYVNSSLDFSENLSYVDSLSNNSGFSDKFSLTSSDNLSYSYATGSSLSSISSLTTSDLDAEMKKLRLELKQNLDMYNAACKEPLTVDSKRGELHQQKSWETRELTKHTEELTSSITAMEKERSKVVVGASCNSQQEEDSKAQKRKIMERKAMHEELANTDIRYRRYTLAEIEAATDYFSNSLKVGEGGYGPVYRAVLDDQTVAIKVLRPDLSQGLKQFQQEVDVLSGMKHPNMVVLVGACPEYGCLIYEYMENGSLEDRLFQKDNTPPIPWPTRFKIASEISTALLFLHQTKPEPLVHRDLKPANILLDNNYLSKISDVGLARLVPASQANNVTQYHMTAAAGTFCYIDPEYQQTGMLGVKSDVYSLGVVLLQIITARPPMGLTHQVEQAIENGKLANVLDPAVKDWPVEAALEYAELALRCCELRKKDRPDLRSEIVPMLKRLKYFGMNNGT